MNTIVLKHRINYFGDDVLTFPDGSEYTMVQYNGSRAKDALKHVKQLISEGNYVFVAEENEFHITVYSALRYITDRIKLNDESNEIINNLPTRPIIAGMEIEGMYGY